MWLFLALVGVPILEILLFIEVGGAIGTWPTLAVVVGTALAGTLLLRAQGREAMVRLQSRLAEGGDPGGPIAHGAMILVAGVLLLTPGFFTDAVGFLLLLPPGREALRRVRAPWAARQTAAQSPRRPIVSPAAQRRSSCCPVPRKPVVLNDAAVHMARGLDDSFLGIEIDPDDTKTFRKTERPFEVIEKRPREVSLERHTQIDGPDACP